MNDSQHFYFGDIQFPNFLGSRNGSKDNDVDDNLDIQYDTVKKFIFASILHCISTNISLLKLRMFFIKTFTCCTYATYILLRINYMLFTPGGLHVTYIYIFFIFTCCTHAMLLTC